MVTKILKTIDGFCKHVDRRLFFIILCPLANVSHWCYSLKITSSQITSDLKVAVLLRLKPYHCDCDCYTKLYEPVFHNINKARKIAFAC